jgi:dipeptidase D
MIFAILADKSLKHGPIEGLFTSDEETTMYGASNLKPGFLKSPYLINVDSEESWRITIGCAGGFEDVIELPLTKAKIDGVPMRIELKGLLGGHSGVEIHEERGNALKLLAQLVHQTIRNINAEDKCGLQYFVGGDKRNVIPPAARCSVVVPKEFFDAFKVELKKQQDILRAGWKTKEKGMTFVEIIGEPGTHVSYDLASSRKFLDVVMIAPHGIIRNSPDVDDLVESSLNFAKVVLCDLEECYKARFEFFPRSSDNDYMPVIHEQLRGLARLIGGTITDMPGIFPGWLPDTTNPLLHKAKEVYKELNGKEPEIYAVHAGLECGMFQNSHPGLKCISVGPYMINVHSPQETLFVDTVPGSYKLIATILEKLK